MHDIGLKEQCVNFYTSTLQAAVFCVKLHATLDLSVTRGRGGGSTLRLLADGKDRAYLDAKISHALLDKSVREAVLKLLFTQSLVPSASAQLSLNLTANTSADRYIVHSHSRNDARLFHLEKNGSLPSVIL